MLIDSVIVKLERFGADIEPDYSITIHGHGAVIYHGRDNVRIKGNKEEKIDDDKVVSIITEFKNADFFSFEETYSVDNPGGVPYATISISLPTEDGQLKTKSVTYYHGAKSTPEELKKLGGKIDEVTRSDRWIKFPLRPKEDSESWPKTPQVKNKQRKPLVISKSIPIKPIAGIVSIIVVIALIAVALNYGFLGTLPTDKEPANSDYEPANIISLITASSIQDGNPNESAFFYLGDTIYVYYRFSNVTHGVNYSITEDVTVLYLGENVDDYHNEFANHSEYDIFYDSCNFSSNKTWSLGEYIVQLKLYDDISKKTAIANTSFTLSRKSPKIVYATTASDVRTYRDYDLKLIFERNDSVCVYVEYTNIETINDSECDLHLELDIAAGGFKYYPPDSSVNKTDVGNNANYWRFPTNESWPTGLYTANLYIKDNISGGSTSGKTYFSLS